MRTYRTEQKTIEQSICTAVICNCCETKVEMLENGWNPDSNDFHDFAIGGGYGSSFPQDMEDISFTLCGSCLKKITDIFKIPPDSSYDEEIK